MRRWLPLLWLLLVPILLFPGAMPGSAVVSADDHLTVHHAYQERAGGQVRHPQLSDPALQFKALRQQVLHALRAGRAPLWNPDILGGAPLLADGQSMVGSPVTWAHLWFSEDVAQDVGVAFVLMWCGLGMALLAGALGLSPWAATVAGAGAMVSPFVQVWLLHPHAATVCWLPWVLWGVERRSPIALALALAGLIGGGHPGTAVISLGVAGLWTAWRCSGGWKPLLVGGVLGMALAAPLWLPFLDHAWSASGDLAPRGRPLPFSALMDLVWPGWWGHPATGGWAGPGAWADGQLHPGLGVLGLALLGMATPLGRGLWATWLVLLAVGLLWPPSPINLARAPSLASLVLALAAGVGTDRLVGAVRWTRVAGAAAWLLVITTSIWARQHDQGTLPAEAHAPDPAPWTEALNKRVGAGRVLGLGWALQPNTGALVGLADVRGYDLPLSPWALALQRRLVPSPRPPWHQVDVLPDGALLDRMGVSVVLSPEPLPDASLPGPLLDLGIAPLFAYEREGWQPMAWFEPASPTTGPTLRMAVERQDPGPEEVRLLVAPAVDGTLVVPDTWDPGWAAEVDGRPVTITQVDGWARGVAVRPGDREVVMRYRPRGWVWGIRIALVGAACCLFWLIRSGCARLRGPLPPLRRLRS